MLQFLGLFVEDDEHGGNAGFLEVGEIRQLPIYSAMSPTDSEDESIGGLPLLRCHLPGDDVESFLRCPIDIRIVPLQFLLERHPDISLATDAEMDGLAVDFIQARRQWKQIDRLLVTYGIETLVDVSHASYLQFY